MKKVGFILPSKEWMGGINYYKNLLYAVSLLNNKKFKPVVFVGAKVDDDIKQIFRPYAQVIEHSMFDTGSFYWFLNQALYKLFDITYFLDKFLRKNEIKILSHHDMVGFKYCKSIGWIPDFQHFHLPGMFSKRNLISRSNKYHKLIKKSDVLVLSSYSALNDLKLFAPDYNCKTAVLQFVSQPHSNYFYLSEKDELYIRNKYNISGNFFYLPNQFWVHKNHITVFKAVRRIVNKGHQITLVCSGLMDDYRDQSHISLLQSYIEDNGLINNILLLGLIPYSDVFCLIKYSCAVINPSLFEGWSSTVEECKTVGKTMILSDLDVHKEQYDNAIFFERTNENDLADKMLLIEQSNNYEVKKSNDVLKKELKMRTMKFAETYNNIIESVEQN